MKVSNSQKASDAHDGVSREALNRWQREDSSNRSKQETARKPGDPKDVGKQAEV